MKEKEIERLKELKKEEEKFYKQGILTVCGIDEAGRGPLAGPVVVACAMMKPDSMIESRIVAMSFCEPRSCSLGLSS